MQIISLFVTFLRKGGDNSHPAWPAGSKGKSCLEYLGACSLAEKKAHSDKTKKSEGRQSSPSSCWFRDKVTSRMVWERVG